MTKSSLWNVGGRYKHRAFILEHGLCVKDTLFPEKILGAETQPKSAEQLSLKAELIFLILMRMLSTA